jgi:histidine triad (HIT) family protein
VPCLFCQIVHKQLPGHIVFEDDISVAFLDTRPLFLGHCLLVTRAHCDSFLDLPGDHMAPFFLNLQRLTAAVERAMSAQGAFVATNIKVSQSVPHLHIHIVPRTKGDGLKGFFWPRKKYQDDAEMSEVAHRIRAAL